MGKRAPKQKQPRALRVVDLFCGSGGLSKGLMDAGMEVVAAYDNWDACVDTYRRNLAGHASSLDLSDTAKAIAQIRAHGADMIAGGPPCQDFSSAGKRVEAGRASLTRRFGEIVAACRPQFVLMENVPGARNSRAYRVMKKLMGDYKFQEMVLDASYCGVPQRRKRFFSFGALKENGRLTDWVAANLSQTGLTVKEYLGDEIDVEFYYRHPRNYSRRAIFTVYEPSPTIRGVNRPIPPKYKGNHLDSAPPRLARPLTTYERSRIQTFPPEWDWGAGNRNAAVELQLGNAVPPQLARFVGEGILHVAA